MHEPHTLASIFPPMDDETYAELRDDIAKHGLAESITLYEGKILDGVHRERACSETGTDARYENYDGDDPQGFVVRRNLLRRQLTILQRADLALKLLPQREKEAKVNKGGRPSSTKPGVSRPSVSGKATARVAAEVGLSQATVRRAKQIKERDPDLWKDVQAGEISIGTAQRKLQNKPPYAPGKDRPPRRTENWNGKTNPKRKRELQQKRREGDYAGLVNTQLQINNLCSALEATELEDFGLDTATLAVVADIHDDLLTLAEWVDRKLHHVGAWLNDVEVRDRIRKLRDTRGRMEEEAATALRLADRLERKLEARLVSVT